MHPNKQYTMTYKIYTSSNYFIIETISGDIYTALSKDVFVEAHILRSGAAYSFHTIEGFSQTPVLLSNLQDEAGTPYTVNTFNNFYETNTGEALSDVNFTTAKDAKLTGIEIGATADLTDAEIKTQLLANTDTFTVTQAQLDKIAENLIDEVSTLSAYGSDLAAATGGILIGQAYVNNTTGIIHRRLA